MSRRQIKQDDRRRALVYANDLLNTYRAAREMAANKAIGAQTYNEKLEYLDAVERYDDAILRLLLVRDVVENSAGLARRLGQLLPGPAGHTRHSASR